MITTLLSAHFSLQELTVTETGLDNTPNAAQTGLLRTLAQFLEKVRILLHNKPVSVDSAFRSAAVNADVGGVPDSAHALCFAADIVCPGYGTPYDVAKTLDKAMAVGALDVDQLIYEQTWVHISRDPQLRGQRLTLTGPDTYIDGIVGP
jgi:hypothetical protein